MRENIVIRNDNESQFIIDKLRESTYKGLSWDIKERPF